MPNNEGSETDAPVKNTVSTTAEKPVATTQPSASDWIKVAQEDIQRNRYQKDEDVLGAYYRAKKSVEANSVKNAADLENLQNVNAENTDDDGRVSFETVSSNDEAVEGEVTDDTQVTDEVVEAEGETTEEVAEVESEPVEGDDLIKKALKKPLKQLDKKTREAALATQELLRMRSEMEELKKRFNNQSARDERASLGDYERRVDLDGLVKEGNDLNQARRNLQNLLLGRDKQDSEGHEYLTILKDGTRITREQAIQWKNDLDLKIDEQIPKRVNTLRQSQQTKQVVQQRISEIYPWSKDPSDSKFLELQGFLSNQKYGYLLEENPELQMLVAAGLNDLQRVVSESAAKKIVSKAGKLVSKPLKSKEGPSAGVSSDTGKSAIMAQHQKLIDAVKSANPRDHIDMLAKLSAFRKQHKIGLVK